MHHLLLKDTLTLWYDLGTLEEGVSYCDNDGGGQRMSTL